MLPPTDTATIHEGYSQDTARIQKGYSQDTERIQKICVLRSEGIRKDQKGSEEIIRDHKGL
ncbi:hypothetical protein ACLOAU_01650 [Niabella sp. CJ426]|uniref:hypothetical protein n=1 Tax=Niabella sp. CJ426 TaxID=3393740 RepID=UPI003D08C93A